jgi:hypothetical protein
MKNPSNTVWSIEEISRQVHRITFYNAKAGAEFWVLLMSDEHWDNAECVRSILTRHHEEAVARHAPIFKFGDLFCAMQGKWDKRADQNQLRPEHRGNTYLDKLVNTAGNYYSPYADSIALITPGNHEQSIVDRHQTNLTERLITILREKSSVPHLGDYWGFVKFRFTDSAKSAIHGGYNNAVNKDLCYHHGYGGGGEVTRGLIDNNRTRGQYNADIFYSGHIHRRNVDENLITEVNRHGKIIIRQQIFLRGSTYKNETRGWHATGGRAARPIGGYWLKFTVRQTHTERVIEMQEIRAT